MCASWAQHWENYSQIKFLLWGSFVKTSSAILDAFFSLVVFPSFYLLPPGCPLSSASALRKRHLKSCRNACIILAFTSQRLHISLHTLEDNSSTKNGDVNLAHFYINNINVKLKKNFTGTNLGILQTLHNIQREPSENFIQLASQKCIIFLHNLHVM